MSHSGREDRIAVTLRRAGPSDLSAVRHFHRALYREHRDGLMPQAIMRLFAYREFDEVLAEDARAMLSDEATVVLVAESAGDVIGYISGHLETDARRMLRRWGIVGDWYVDERVRGSGVGQRLMAGLEAVFREAGCELVQIATWPFNTATRAIIERSGYAEVQVTYRKELSQSDP